MAGEIAEHFQYYGLLSHGLGLSFLLEVAAHDIAQICRVVHGQAPRPDESRMLDLLLDLDQEIKEESNEPSLLGVRRAQIQLAAFLLGEGDEAGARRICGDLSRRRSRPGSPACSRSSAPRPAPAITSSPTAA